MTSASTKRRRARDEELLEQWAGTPPGTKVTVTRANGETLRTRTLFPPFSQDGHGAYINVAGIPGNTHLRRVALGWKTPKQSNETRAELERLRSVMVHAMDDAEWAAQNPLCGTNERATFQKIARSIKSALEKK